MSSTSYIKNIQLFSEPNYKVDITLESNAFKLNFVWNERLKRYSFDLLKSDGTPVFEGLILSEGRMTPLANSNMNLYGLHGYFLLSPLDSSLTITDEFYRDWANYFILTYSIDIPD